MPEAEAAEHSHELPIHKPFSLSTSYFAQLGDEGDRLVKDLREPEETKAQRKSRMTAVYDKAVIAAEDAEHSHQLPIHKPWSLATSYFA